MAKRIQHAGKANKDNGTRAPRFATLEELQQAVREQIVQELEREGYHWSDHYQSALHESIEDEPRRLLEALTKAFTDAENFIAQRFMGQQELEPRPCYNAFTLRLCDILAVIPERARLRIWGSHAINESDQHYVTGRDEWSNRKRLMMAHRRNGAWWWSHRPNGEPTMRDLALLTLLAGEFPSGIARQQQEATGERDRPTVANVIEAEMKTIGVLLDRIEKQAEEGPWPPRARVVMGCTCDALYADDCSSRRTGGDCLCSCHPSRLQITRRLAIWPGELRRCESCRGRGYVVGDDGKTRITCGDCDGEGEHRGPSTAGDAGGEDVDGV